MSEYNVSFNVFTAQQNRSDNDKLNENSGTWTVTTSDSTGEWWTDGTTTDHTTITYPTVTAPDSWTSITTTWPIDPWQGIEHPVGIIYVEDNKLKLKDKDGNEIIIADLDDDDISAKLIAVIAKKKLDEGDPEFIPQYYTTRIEETMFAGDCDGE